MNPVMCSVFLLCVKSHDFSQPLSICYFGDFHLVHTLSYLFMNIHKVNIENYLAIDVNSVHSRCWGCINEGCNA